MKNRDREDFYRWQFEVMMATGEYVMAAVIAEQQHLGRECELVAAYAMIDRLKESLDNDRARLGDARYWAVQEHIKAGIWATVNQMENTIKLFKLDPLPVLQFIGSVPVPLRADQQTQRVLSLSPIAPN